MDGIGLIDPDLARDLARAAAANPKTTWCVTVTDTDGNTIDTSEFFGKGGQAGLETEDATEDAAGPEEEAEDSAETHDADEADQSSADVVREASDEAAE